MGEVGSAAAVLVAAAFAWAGATKLARPEATAQAFRTLNLPAVAPAARALPLLELAVAAGLVMAPRAGGMAALVLLMLFTVLLVRAIAAGATTGCGCFGAVADEPVSVLDVARNCLLAAGAVAALGAPRLVAPSVPAATLVGGAALSGWLLLSLARASRHTADRAS